MVESGVESWLKVLVAAWLKVVWRLSSGTRFKWSFGSNMLMRLRTRFQRGFTLKYRKMGRKCGKKKPGANPSQGIFPL